LREIGDRPAPGLEYAFVINDDGAGFDGKAFEGRLTILNFWATWCPPCRQEMRELNALGRRYADRGVRVVGLTKFFHLEEEDWTEERELSDIRDVLEQFDVTYPVLVARNAAAWEDYHAAGVPVTVLIGREGKPVAFGSGLKGAKHVLKKLESLMQAP
jgi:thiol-disulfide isomerase/thioredoxin